MKRAKEEVAKENKNMTKDIVVYLMDGVYFVYTGSFGIKGMDGRFIKVGKLGGKS